MARRARIGGTFGPNRLNTRVTTPPGRVRRVGNNAEGAAAAYTQGDRGRGGLNLGRGRRANPLAFRARARARVG